MAMTQENGEYYFPYVAIAILASAASSERHGMSYTSCMT